jgi:hypothetical protein
MPLYNKNIFGVFDIGIETDKISEFLGVWIEVLRKFLELALQSADFFWIKVRFQNGKVNFADL